MHVLWSRIHFKLISLEFALTILIAERTERCAVEKVFKEKREREKERERERERKIFSPGLLTIRVAAYLT